MLSNKQFQKFFKEAALNTPPTILKSNNCIPYGDFEIDYENDSSEPVIKDYKPIYSCIKNSPSNEIIYEKGRTYVNIGFVDNSMHLFGKIIDRGLKGPVKSHNVDMSAICVARSILIYEMMK